MGEILATDEWKTPWEIYAPLDRVFQFTMDPCTTKENWLGCRNFYTKETDGLAQPWSEEAVFCNPPYSRGNIERWVEKCAREGERARVVALLCRADRSTKWWQTWVAPHAWKIHDYSHRIRFVGAPAAYNFPSALALFGNIFGDRP